MRTGWLIVATFLLPSVVHAQEVASGPEKGKPVPALKVFDATGTHEGKDVDYTAERKDKPTIYLLVNADQFSRPMARFMRLLDEKVTKDGEPRYIVAVWVGGDKDKNKEYLPRAQMSLKLESTAMTAFMGDKAGPEGWTLNEDAHLTAVVAVKGKVAVTFGYTSINDTDVKAVHEALIKIAPVK